MVSRTVIQHESSNSLVVTIAHSPVGARLRSECRSTMASAPPRPSGASPLTGWFAISCVRPSPVTANSPSPHVATSIVGFVTDYLPFPSCRGLSELLNKAIRSLWQRAIVAGQCARPIHDFPAKSPLPRGPLRLLAPGLRASPGAPDRPDLPALSSSAEEPIAAIGLKPGHTHAGRHIESLQDLSRSRIDSPHVALRTFPGRVPELSVDPRDSGDEAVGFDDAKDRPCFGIDLMDLAAPIMPDPERPFGPSEPRVTAAPGRRDGGEHTPGLRIDLLDAILSDLKQVLAVEGGSCMRGDFDGAPHLSVRRIEGVQRVSRCKPDLLTVIRDAIDFVDTRKGSILTDDLGV